MYAALSRPVLPEAAITEPALQKMERFHTDTIEKIRTTVAGTKIVVVGMSGNPHVRRARRALLAAGRPFEYLEFGSYFGGWRERLAIKLWSGWPTFPQVFVDGRLVGGADELQKALAEERV